MRIFKKALIKTLCFIICIAIVSAPFIFVYFKYGTHGSVDRGEMKAFSGKISTLALGDSQLMNGFVPAVFDECMGDGISFNGSSNGASLRERYTILEGYVKYNPIDLVILDISYNAFTTDYVAERDFESKLIAFDHVIDNRERINMLFSNQSLGDLFSIYKYMMSNAFLDIYLTIFGNDGGRMSQYRSQGYFPNTNGPFVPEAPIEELRDTRYISPEYHEDELHWFEKIVELCRENDIQIVAVTTPVTDYLLEQYSNRDAAHNAFEEFFAKHGIRYIDFNQPEIYADTFNDYSLFFDYYHMNVYGGIVFTEKLASMLLH